MTLHIVKQKVHNSTIVTRLTYILPSVLLVHTSNDLVGRTPVRFKLTSTWPSLEVMAEAFPFGAG